MATVGKEHPNVIKVAELLLSREIDLIEINYTEAELNEAESWLATYPEPDQHYIDLMEIHNMRHEALTENLPGVVGHVVWDLYEINANYD